MAIQRIDKSYRATIDFDAPHDEDLVTTDELRGIAPPEEARTRHLKTVGGARKEVGEKKKLIGAVNFVFFLVLGVNIFISCRITQL